MMFSCCWWRVCRLLGWCMGWEGRMTDEFTSWQTGCMITTIHCFCLCLSVFTTVNNDLSQQSPISIEILLLIYSSAVLVKLLTYHFVSNTITSIVSVTIVVGSQSYVNNENILEYNKKNKSFIWNQIST